MVWSGFRVPGWMGWLVGFKAGFRFRIVSSSFWSTGLVAFRAGFTCWCSAGDEGMTQGVGMTGNHRGMDLYRGHFLIPC